MSLEVTSWLVLPGDDGPQGGDFFFNSFLIGGQLLYSVVFLGEFFEDRKNTPSFSVALGFSVYFVESVFLFLISGESGKAQRMQG